MPQNDSEATLLVQYTESSATYSYAQLSLISALPDQSQIEVRWDVDIVYEAAGNSGVAYTVENLSESAQATIKTLVAGTQYTINTENNTITLEIAEIADQPVTTESGVTYYYPSTVTISGSQNLQIRRATDITTQLVTFQPGSRLTAENLNLSSAQLFNALQELTVFGISEGGIVTGLDLGNSSITELSDVNLATTGLLQWNGNMVLAGGDAGNLVPSTAALDNIPPNFADVGKAVLFGTPTEGTDIHWEFITYDDVRDNKTGTNKLSTRLNSMTTDITNLQNKTGNITEPIIGGPSVLAQGATITDGGLTVTSGDVALTSGDVVIQSASVYDYISHEPYFWQLPVGDSSNISNPTGSKTLGLTDDFENHDSFQYASSTAVSEFDFTTGLWTAPRDMVITVAMTWSINPDTTGTLNSLGRIYHNGGSVGAPVYLRQDDALYQSASKIVTLKVFAGNTIECVIEREGGAVFSVENAEACLHEVR